MRNMARGQQQSEKVERIQGWNENSGDIADLLRDGRRMHDAAVYQAFSQLGRLIGKLFGTPGDQGHGGMLPKSRRPHGRAA